MTVIFRWSGDVYQISRPLQAQRDSCQCSLPRGIKRYSYIFYLWEWYIYEVYNDLNREHFIGIEPLCGLEVFYLYIDLFIFIVLFLPYIKLVRFIRVGVGWRWITLPFPSVVGVLTQINAFIGHPDHRCVEFWHSSDIHLIMSVLSAFWWPCYFIYEDRTWNICTIILNYFSRYLFLFRCCYHDHLLLELLLDIPFILCLTSTRNGYLSTCLWSCCMVLTFCACIFRCMRI